MVHSIPRNKFRSVPLLLRKSQHRICEAFYFYTVNSKNGQIINENVYGINNRQFSGITRGTDLLADSLSFSDKPKIVFDGHSPTGIDVYNIITNNENDKFPKSSAEKKSSTDNVQSFDSLDSEESKQQLESIHMNGSCLAFPHSCFLWKPQKPQEVTVESLEVVMCVDPPIELLFIGCDSTIPPRAMNVIKKEFKRRKGIIVEQMNLVSFLFISSRIIVHVLFVCVTHYAIYIQFFTFKSNIYSIYREISRMQWQHLIF